VAALLLVLVFSANPPAWSWGNTGHEAVACAAWKLLDQATKDKVWALLQQVPTRKSVDGTKFIPGFQEWTANLPANLTDDQKRMFVFMRAATYPDSIKHTFLNDSDRAPTDMGEATANLGFTDPDSHGYWHFVNTPFGTLAKGQPGTGKTSSAPAPVNALPATPPVNAVSEIILLSQKITAGESGDLTAYDMMWLEHLVGDVHQPLHAAERFVNGVGDLGGNSVSIGISDPNVRMHFTGSDPTSKPPAQLHAFWDVLPGEGGPMDTQLAVDYAATLPAADPALAKISDPKVWASESFAMAESDAYSGPIGAGMGPFNITQAYLNQAAGDAQKRIALAGARLANLLMSVLQGTAPRSGAAIRSRRMHHRPALNLPAFSGQ
jgi:hypothetical protein